MRMGMKRVAALGLIIALSACDALIGLEGEPEVQHFEFQRVSWEELFNSNNIDTLDNSAELPAPKFSLHGSRVRITGSTVLSGGAPATAGLERTDKGVVLSVELGGDPTRTAQPRPISFEAVLRNAASLPALGVRFPDAFLPTQQGVVYWFDSR